jgi:uncharacterized protein (DUF2225 family)
MPKEKVKCGLCGTKSHVSVVDDTGPFVLQDLDTRPAGLMPAAMSAWVQRCPKCGYCASDIRTRQEGAEAVIEGIEYKKQLDDHLYPYLANSFICKALINCRAREYGGAAFAYIHAAWVCDDSNNDDRAAVCRQKAAEMLEIAEKYGQPVTEYRAEMTAVLADLLRRAGRFEQAGQMIETREKNDAGEEIERILRFEAELIRKKDSSCRTIEEALNNMNN